MHLDLRIALEALDGRLVQAAAVVEGVDCDARLAQERGDLPPAAAPVEYPARSARREIASERAVLSIWGPERRFASSGRRRSLDKARECSPA